MDPGDRIQIEQSNHEVRTLIEPDRHWLARFVTTVSATVFLFIPVGVFAAMLLSDDHPTGAAFGIVLAFGIAAIAVFVAVAYDATWKVFGLEEIILREGEFEIATVLFGRRRVRRFSVARITNLRYEERAGRHWARKAILFDYNGREIASTHQLTSEEGRRLIRGPLRDLVRQRGHEPPIIEI